MWRVLLKSGRSSRQNAEVEGTSSGRPEIDQHVVHACAGRAPPNSTLEARDGLIVALDEDLHPTVVEVLNRAGEALASRGVAREVAEADALHPASHDEAASDEHEPLIIPGTMGQCRSIDAMADWVPLERRELSPRFTDALGVAAEIHAGQRRKGSGPPYIAHLLGVTSIAFDFGATEDEAIGALLHDAIEDAPPSLGADGVRRLIADRFGDIVLEIVEGCTDSDATPKPPWIVRKTGYVEHLRDAGPSVLLVSASDKLHNVRAITSDYRRVGDEVWKKFSPDAGKARTIGYYRGLVTAFQRRAAIGTDGFGRLLRELDADVGALEALAGVEGIWPPLP